MEISRRKKAVISKVLRRAERELLAATGLDLSLSYDASADYSRADEVLEKVAWFTGITVRVIKSDNQTDPVVRARHYCIVLLRDVFNYSFPKMALILGYRDHSAVCVAYHKSKGFIAVKETYFMVYYPQLEIAINKLKVNG